MKMPKKRNHTKVALFAGATALMSLAPQTYAQSSVDALLDKLEQKGILSVDEAKELKAENATNSVDDFNKALGAKFPTSDWVTSYRLYGDFRGRFDDISTSGPVGTPGTPNSSFNNSENQTRLRYRLRVGLTINMKNNTEVGFRLASDDAASSSNTAGGGNPLSNNSTLQGNGSKKGIYVDAAYGKWTPINDGTWKLAGTFGKMDNPFQLSPMVFDPDYTPEGAALQGTYKISDNQSLMLNNAFFILNQFNSRDPLMYGSQIIWNANWTPKLSSSVGLAALDIDNINEGTDAGGDFGRWLRFQSWQYHQNCQYQRQSVCLSGEQLQSHHRRCECDIYAGQFSPLPRRVPVKLAGEYMVNPGASGSNQGWWTGATIGKSGKKGMWDITYRYQYLEADAWWDQVVDDDNVARFLTTPTSPTTTSAVGGTNIKGHLVKFNYSIFDSLTFSFTAYINDLISNPYPGTSTDAIHAMADLMWKF